MDPLNHPVVGTTPTSDTEAKSFQQSSEFSVTAAAASAPPPALPTTAAKSASSYTHSPTADFDSCGSRRVLAAVRNWDKKQPQQRKKRLHPQQWSEPAGREQHRSLLQSEKQQERMSQQNQPSVCEQTQHHETQLHSDSQGVPQRQLLQQPLDFQMQWQQLIESEQRQQQQQSRYPAWARVFYRDNSSGKPQNKGTKARRAGCRTPHWLPVGCLDRLGEPPLHTNIYLMFYFRALNALAYAARSASIFDTYLHLRFGGNSAIGMLSSFSGLITIIVAPLSGYISDRFKSHRSLFLRGAAVFTLACTYVSWLAVQRDDFSLIILSTFMWKGWHEFVSVCSESLFNDCMPPGRRSELYVFRRVVTSLANGAGPLVSLAAFAVEGNTWSISVLHSVLHVGIILSLPQVFLLWWWEDVNETAPRTETAAADETKKQHQQEHEQQNREQVRAANISRASLDLEQRNIDAIQDQQDERQLNSTAESKGIHATRTGLAVVPWLIFASHCITFSGAGMTVKYFPLFFKSEYNFKPIHTCLLSSTYTLVIVVFTCAIQRFAARWGRAQASLGFTFLGIACLMLLAHLRSLPLVILVYLLRGAFQNASTPLDRSLIMDSVNSKHLGRWSALQSLSTMMWSLSALFGGFISDRISYRSTFMITGCVYIVAELIYLPILWLLPSDFDSQMSQTPDAQKRAILVAGDCKEEASDEENALCG